MAPLAEVPASVWSAVIGLIAGVLGVSLGALLQRRFERRSWEYEIRLDAYGAFLGSFDEMFGLMHEELADLREIDAAKRDATFRLSRLNLVGSEEAIHRARNALFQLGLVVIAGKYAGVTGNVDLRHADYAPAMDQRRAFIAAARKDIDVHPLAVATRVIGPAEEASD